MFRLGRREFLAATAALIATRAPAQEPSLDRALLRAHPRLRALSWIDLGGLPTPVERAPSSLERELGHALWIKRDDLAGEGFGGSKARKLELFLAEARGRVLTFGGAGSNHALATAFHAHRLGLPCALVLLPEPPADHVERHLLAAHGLGAELHAGRRADLDDGGARFGPAYVIPQGGTSALGSVGYVGAGFELARQCATGELPIPDHVFIATGTTGAAAGLYVGLRAAGLTSSLVAVRASSRASANEARLAREIGETVSLLRRIDPHFPDVGVDRNVRIEHRFAGAGYAIPSAAGERASALARGLIDLDPTYTAKAFAALIAARLRGPALFWNTYDARPIATASTEENLPPAFRRYFRRRRV